MSYAQMQFMERLDKRKSVLRKLINDIRITDINDNDEDNTDNKNNKNDTNKNNDD